MGLDSLMALEFLHHLELEFALTLPPSRITAHSTIKLLAASLLELLDAPAVPAPAAVASAPRLERCVALRAGRRAGGLFLIHPAGGAITIYQELAVSMAEGIAVYGLPSRSLTGAEPEFETLSELALDYADRIDRQQPDATLHLGGFSAGGIFALAIARELERRGRQVALVALFDAPLAVLDPQCRWERVLAQLFGDLYDHYAAGTGLPAGGDLQDRAQRLFELAAQVAAAGDEATQLRLLVEGFGPLGVDRRHSADAGPMQSLELCIRHANLLRGSAVPTIAAPVRAWRAAGSQLNAAALGAAARARISRGGCVEVPVDGQHFDLMRAPRVRTLASMVSEAIAPRDRGPRPSRVSAVPELEPAGVDE